ncbi:amidohydrolase [Rufibacter glacialis]|uniref:Omega-amidase YafV n=1 Tax=Rufibacter glacialis TaxID=1259555 RepID=A0A5M8Q5N2_9BACT|nr:amidohydrolase [Rufibacter glacialis]KAA6430226.1 amidohydrolase [Rufibacter glacialis]GGK87499.1 nitrilase family protein [Rufibacter glacialis]
MTDLRVSLLQLDLAWHDAAANRANFQAKIEQLPQTDLIILPEMFTTGFSMDAPALAEEMDGPSVAWMRQMAQQRDAVVMGSLIIQENGQYYNRLVWMRLDGTYAHYDKRHLFRMAGECEAYSPGTQKLIVEVKGWNICPLVCYDLRFPVWSRNTPISYDVLIYIASWPDRRRLAWQTLLKARAIENLAYCIGVNRVGIDAKGHAYAGDSAAYNLLGEELAHHEHEEAVTTITLSRQHLEETRQKLPWHLDADAFTLGVD